MQLTIPSAKILGAEKLPEQKTLKYTYFDTQTGLKDSFYSHQKVNHIPNLPDYLWLTIDNNQQDKNFFLFSQKLHQEWQKEPIKFEQPLEKEVLKIESKQKKITTKLTPWQIKKLREKGFSWQEIREFCGGVSEWTIRRWNKEEEVKEKKKGGRPLKINGSNLVHLETCVGAFKFLTQEWIAKWYSEKIGTKVSQPTISRLYKKYGITEKVINYYYSEQEVFLGGY